MVREVKVKFTLNIGMDGSDREEIVAFDRADLPTDPCRLEYFLDVAWNNWAINYIDGNAFVIEGQENE